MRRPATSLSLDLLGAVLHKCSDQARSTVHFVSNDLSLAGSQRVSEKMRVADEYENVREIGISNSAKPEFTRDVL